MSSFAPIRPQPLAPIDPVVKWTLAFAGSGFFEAVGMGIVQGRPLSKAGHEGEVAVNESLARALFGDADPVGRRFAMSPTAPMLTIAGVMKDARQVSPRDRGIGVAYLPIRRYGRVTLAVRRGNERRSGQHDSPRASIRSRSCGTSKVVQLRSDSSSPAHCTSKRPVAAEAARQPAAYGPLITGTSVLTPH